MKTQLVMLAWVVLGVSAFGFADSDKKERTLTVQGQGKVFTVPDVARISVEVSRDGVELDPVLVQVRKDMARVLEAIQGQGLPEKDIQTELFQVHPKVERDKNGNQRRVGFVVTNRASVKVRDIKKTGKVLSVALSAGATSVNGPDFELDNPSAAEREALAAATKDAKAKAQTVAEAAGVQLGEILSINPQQVSWPSPRRFAARAMMMDSAMAEEPIAAGEQTLVAYTSITFVIK